MSDEAMKLLFSLGDIDEALVEEARPKDMPTCFDEESGIVRRIGPKLLIIALAAALPTAAVAGGNLDSIRSALKANTSDAGMSPGTVEFLSKRLDALGMTGSEIRSTEPLRVNLYEQTYGADIYEPDLVAVQASNGKDGYAYRAELEDTPYESTATPDAVAEIETGQMPRTVKVYREDGRTVIGRCTVGEDMGAEPAPLSARQRALSPTALRLASRSYASFLAGKRGYSCIVQIQGLKTPVLLWSKRRLAGYTGNHTNSASVYVLSRGKTKLVGKVANSSSGEPLTLHRGKLRFGDHHAKGYVTVRRGKFEGARYSAHWKSVTKVRYYRQDIVNGKTRGPKKRIGERVGEKRVYGDMGWVLRFEKNG